MDAREQRGLVIAAVCKLNRADDGTWLVPSQSQGETVYRNLQRIRFECVAGGGNALHEANSLQSRFTHTRTHRGSRNCALLVSKNCHSEKVSAVRSIISPQL